MASNPQHEPTMEEILASIRKIISEDSAEAPAHVKAAAPQPVAVHEPEPEPEGDVLELTEPIEEEPEPAPLLAEPAPLPAEPAPLPEEPEPAHDVVFQTIEEAAVSSAPPEAAPSEGIFSDKTRKAFDDTFASIKPVETPAQPAPPAAPVAPLAGADVEAVFERAIRETFDPVLAKWLADNSGAIVDRMKPMIREWMDENFPALLEEAVRSEVARVVRARKR
jgi:uncharacterized protein